jgi:hypothetical protein
MMLVVGRYGHLRNQPHFDGSLALIVSPGRS